MNLTLIFSHFHLLESDSILLLFKYSFIFILSYFSSIMAKAIKNIALYGGSFDPPHKSHIALIRFL